MRLGDVDRSGIRVIGKKSVERVVFIQDDLASAILSYAQDMGLNQTSFLFLSRKGAHITRQRTDQIVKAAGRRAHLPRNVHAQLFRHGYAINFLNTGGRLDALQEQMGYQTPLPTHIYLRIADENPALER